MRPARLGRVRAGDRPLRSGGHYGPFDSPWGVPRTRLGNDPVGITKVRSAHEPPGTVGSPLERGGMMVAAADEWVAVHRMWLDGRALSPREVCSQGDRLGDGASG